MKRELKTRLRTSPALNAFEELTKSLEVSAPKEDFGHAFRRIVIGLNHLRKLFVRKHLVACVTLP